MKKLILSLALFYMVTIPNLMGQTAKTKRLGLHWGVGNLQRQDIRFSPFVHKPWSAFNLGLSYEHQGEQFHRVYARFGWYKAMVGKPYSYVNTIENPPQEYETLPHNFNILDLDYTLGFSIDKTSKAELFLGGKVRNLINQGPYDYGNSAVGAYNFSFGLDLWSGFHYKISKKHLVKAELSIPVITWVAASPYLGQNDEYIMNSSSLSTMKIVGSYISAGEIQSWGKLQRIDFQAGYLSCILPWRWQSVQSLVWSLLVQPVSVLIIR